MYVFLCVPFLIAEKKKKGARARREGGASGLPGETKQDTKTPPRTCVPSTVHAASARFDKLDSQSHGFIDALAHAYTCVLAARRTDPARLVVRCATEARINEP